jgi:tetratricopeptide (TPR) repeat protein
VLLALHKRDEAAAAVQAALATFAKLAAEYPAVPDFRSELARSHQDLGTLLRDQGRGAEAEAAYRAALALRQELADEHPAVPDYRINLGDSFRTLGSLLSEQGEPAALEWFAKAIATLEPIHRSDPRLVTARRGLCNSHAGRARALARLDRHAEALADWDRALALDDGAARTQIRLGRADALARTGAADQARAAADDLAAAPQLSAANRYDLARVYALTGAKLPPADGDAVAAKAVAALRQAFAAGYRDVPHLLNDADLAPLRRRADYAALLWDLADGPAAPSGQPKPAGP